MKTRAHRESAFLAFLRSLFRRKNDRPRPRGEPVTKEERRGAAVDGGRRESRWLPPGSAPEPTENVEEILRDMNLDVLLKDVNGGGAAAPVVGGAAEAETSAPADPESAEEAARTFAGEFPSRDEEETVPAEAEESPRGWRRIFRAPTRSRHANTGKDADIPPRSGEDIDEVLEDVDLDALLRNAGLEPVSPKESVTAAPPPPPAAPTSPVNPSRAEAPSTVLPRSTPKKSPPAKTTVEKPAPANVPVPPKKGGWGSFFHFLFPSRATPPAKEGARPAGASLSARGAAEPVSLDALLAEPDARPADSGGAILRAQPPLPVGVPLSNLVYREQKTPVPETPPDAGEGAFSSAKEPFIRREKSAATFDGIPLRAPAPEKPVKEKEKELPKPEERPLTEKERKQKEDEAALREQAEKRRKEEQARREKEAQDAKKGAPPPPAAPHASLRARENIFVGVYNAVRHMGLGRERSTIVENLATMLNAGLPLVDSLRTLRMETHHKAARDLLQRILDRVESGSPLWRAMLVEHFFSPDSLALVRIGEEAGNLAANMAYLAVQQQKDADLRSKVKMAMIYPSIVLVLMFVIVIGLGMFVLPNLVSVLYSLNVSLPLITRLVIAFTNLFSQHGAIIVPGCIVGFLIVGVLVKFTPLQVAAQWLVFRIPGIGALLWEATIARFGVIIGGLLQAGVPLVDALRSLVEVTTILSYRRFYERLLEHILVGDSFAKSFAALRGSEKFLPLSVQQLVMTGERTGSLSKVMLKIADIYERKANETAQKLPVILEPMLLLFIGALVGTIAFSIIVPIYSIVGSVNK